MPLWRWKGKNILGWALSRCRGLARRTLPAEAKKRGEASGGRRRADDLLWTPVPRAWRLLGPGAQHSKPNSSKGWWRCPRTLNRACAASKIEKTTAESKLITVDLDRDRTYHSVNNSNKSNTTRKSSERFLLLKHSIGRTGASGYTLPLPPGSSVHGILQARILEWVAISFSRGSSWPMDWTHVCHTAGRFFSVWATREAQM